MSLEESINRLITVIESRWPVTGVAVPASNAPAPIRTPASRPAAPKSPPPPKYEDVRLAILDLSERTDVDTAIGVLKQFEVSHAKSLKVEQYTDVLKAINKALQPA